MSFSPRKKLSRCPAMPEFPSVPGSGRVLDVTDGAVERSVVGARQHRHLESNLRDSEHRERGGGRFAQRLVPGADASWRPEGLIRRAGLRRDDLKCREALEIVPRRDGNADLERAPPHHADKAECPARSLGDQ